MKGMPMKRGLTLLELIVIVVVIFILAALMIPPFEQSRRRARVTSCASNFSQLWKLQNVYMSQFGGRLRAMPEATGQAFWKALTTTQPPLIDASVNDIFLCPVLGTSEAGACDYGGPAKKVSTLADDAPVGADLPDNHKEGPNDPGSGCVLRKSGDVTELVGPDWKKLVADPLYPRP